MKTAIVYYSAHHGNTKKLLTAIAEKFPVTLIDITEKPRPDLSEYDRIGFASGIYYSKLHKTLISTAAEMPENKKVFFIYTYGAEKKGYTAAISAAALKRNAKILGEFGCLGFNTFGPFKLIGGIAKGHPDSDDVENACNFYENLQV